MFTGERSLFSIISSSWSIGGIIRDESTKAMMSRWLLAGFQARQTFSYQISLSRPMCAFVSGGTFPAKFVISLPGGTFCEKLTEEWDWCFQGDKHFRVHFIYSLHYYSSYLRCDYCYLPIRNLSLHRYGVHVNNIRGTLLHVPS